MADPYHQYHESVILDCGDDSVIASSITPEPSAVAGERMAEATRILTAGDAFAQVT